MNGGVKWYGDKFDDRLEGQLQDGVVDATDFYANQLRAKISTQGPPRSAPGEAPHVDTEALIKSIDERVDRNALAGQISSDVPHSVYLEMGTTNMAPRPAWIPTLMENADELATRLTGTKK